MVSHFLFLRDHQSPRRSDPHVGVKVQGAHQQLQTILKVSPTFALGAIIMPKFILAQISAASEIAAERCHVGAIFGAQLWSPERTHSRMVRMPSSVLRT